MPAGCETINVSGTTNGVADGNYTFDATTQAWINDNNVEWTVQKTWWEADALGAGVPATSGFRWSFSFSGTTQPAGAVTVRMLRHPTLMPHAYSGLPAQWTPNSAHDLNGTVQTPSVNASINPIFLEEWVPVRVNLKRYDDAWHTNLLDTGTMDIDFSNVEGYSGTGTPTTVQWAAAMAGRSFIGIKSVNSYSGTGILAPTMVQYTLSTNNLHSPYWQKTTPNDTRIYRTHSWPPGSDSLSLYFGVSGGVNTNNWTTYDAALNTKYYWQAEGEIVPGTRAFNELIYPDKNASGANYDLLTEGFTFGTGWSASAPLNNYPLNLVDANNGTYVQWVGNYLDFGYGSSWGIDLGMAPDGGETCPSEANWTGTGIAIIAPPSAPTGFAAVQHPWTLPAAPTNFSAGVIPSAPTNFSAGVIPSAPTNFVATQLAVPSAPTGFGAVQTGVPSAPSNFVATQLAVPSAPSNFVATQLAVPSAPTGFGAVQTGVPSAPTGFEALVDLDSIVPSAPVLGTASVYRFAGWTRPARYKGYVYSELGKSLTGPFVGGNITALTSVRGTGSLVSVSGDDSPSGETVYEIRSTDLSKFRERDFGEAPVGVWPYPQLAPPSTTAANFIVGSENGAFAYRGRYLTSPFSESLVGNIAIDSPLYFEDGHLAIAETAWMHLGNEHNNKQVHRLDFNFSTGSFGHLWAYIQSDSEQGKVSGQYKGPIENNVRVFTNIRGRRFRVKLFIATHKDHPWNLREMAVGHLVGKSF